MKLYIGLMSGTSMDGIDAALVDVETHRLVHGITKPYSPELKKMLHFLVSNEKHSLQTIYQVNTQIGREFGAATNELLAESHMSYTDIEAIGNHGQTICHNAEALIPYTVQLGCSHTIAEMSKIPVVADFRSRDLVLGGQGAPLAPLYHQTLFANLGFPLAIVNVGGIANLTCIHNEGQVIGYDVGPGNCLMDTWITLHQGKPYDAEGNWAKEGQVIDQLLDEMLADPFFKKNHPKSIGKEYFSLNWLKLFINRPYEPVDIQTTLLQLTARTIADAINAQQSSLNRVLICGGGAHNSQFLSVLAQELPGVDICSTANFLINPDFIEAQMMAWLAHQMIIKKSLDLKSITGSKQKTVLGVLYPAGIPN